MQSLRDDHSSGQVWEWTEKCNQIQDLVGERSLGVGEGWDVGSEGQ